MNKKKTRAAIKEAEKIVAGLKSSGAINEDAKVEIRVAGQRRKLKKQQTKPR